MKLPTEEAHSPSPASDQDLAYCLTPGCGGPVVRHSLGAGQSVLRCMRCFRRYSRSIAVAPGGTALRRFVRDFVNWREP